MYVERYVHCDVSLALEKAFLCTRKKTKRIFKEFPGHRIKKLHVYIQLSLRTWARGDDLNLSGAVWTISILTVQLEGKVGSSSFCHFSVERHDYLRLKSKCLSESTLRCKLVFRLHTTANYMNAKKSTVVEVSSCVPLLASEAFPSLTLKPSNSLQNLLISKLSFVLPSRVKTSTEIESCSFGITC